MRWQSLSVFALVVAATSTALANQGQPGKDTGPRSMWWQSERVRQELNLTADQSARLEQVFQATRPRLHQAKEELDRLEAELSKLLRQDEVNEDDVTRLVDRVEVARSELSKTRTLMLFRMHRLLTMQQRDQLRTLQKEWDRERRRPSRP